MRRNTPLFLLVLSAYIGLAGLVLIVYQDCSILPGTVCAHPFFGLGSVLAIAGPVGMLVVIVLEVFVGLRQTPSDVLPSPPVCWVCAEPLVFFFDYGLWYCPYCGQYSQPRTTAHAPPATKLP